MPPVAAVPCLCATCGEQTAASPCVACGADPLLEGRYRLLGVLGHGGNATTYRAERLADGLPVAIKELLLRRIDAFKTKDLFEREAAVLRTLDHPGIPAYVDELSAGSGKQLGFYLAQELVEGQSLQAELEGTRYDERQVAAILAEVAEILTYLHGLRPPVIHRDLKPSNILRRAADGRLVLIDFGAVKDAVDGEEGGSTVAGTFGFMAPEQFAGQASPATDLYGLGATAVALLTRTSPQELLDVTHELRWREAVTAGPSFTALLERLLVRDPAERMADAAEAASWLRAIAAGQGPTPVASTASSQPAAKDATLLQVMKGEVPVADLIEQVQRASWPGQAGGRPPPQLYVEPPPTPRPGGLGRARKMDAMVGFNLLFGGIFGGVGGFIGLVFVSVALFSDAPPLMGLLGGGMGSVFFGVGAWVFSKGWRRLQRMKHIWQDGRLAHASLDNVHLDTSVKSNGRSPWMVDYHFVVAGRTHSGSSSTWNRSVRFAHRGQKLAVLYDPANPDDNMALLPQGR